MIQIKSALSRNELLSMRIYWALKQAREQRRLVLNLLLKQMRDPVTGNLAIEYFYNRKER